jgi:hypothetical protein
MFRYAVLMTALPAFFVSTLIAEDNGDVKKELQELREQNRLLQNQLQQQQQMLDQLSTKFSGLEKTNEQYQSDLRSMKADTEGATPPSEKPGGFSVGNVVFSGEGAAGFYETGSSGKYPNAAFRVNEARLFADAQIWDDTYFYAQLDLITPHAPDNGLYLGELYMQFEKLAKNWNMDDLLKYASANFTFHSARSTSVGSPSTNR